MKLRHAYNLKYTPNHNKELALEEISILTLQVKTLETRGRDALDFHEIGVWNLKRALHQAYEAGMKAAEAELAGKPKPTFVNHTTPEPAEFIKNSKGEYLYHFEWAEGGFNEGWGRNIKELQKDIQARFPNTSLTIFVPSIKTATQADVEAREKRARMEFY